MTKSEINVEPPSAFCPVCQTRCPIRWRDDPFKRTESITPQDDIEPKQEAGGSPGLPDDDNAPEPICGPLAEDADMDIDNDVLEECDLWGNSRKTEQKSRPSAAQPLPPPPPVNEWFECAVCGNPIPKLEFISIQEAVRRNRQRDEKRKSEGE